MYLTEQSIFSAKTKDIRNPEKHERGLLQVWVEIVTEICGRVAKFGNHWLHVNNLHAMELLTRV